MNVTEFEPIEITASVRWSGEKPDSQHAGPADKPAFQYDVAIKPKLAATTSGPKGTAPIQSDALPVQWADMNNVENVFGFNDAFGNSGLLVGAFRFVGSNRSGIPVTKVQASVQAELRKEPITLGFVNRNIPNKGHIVPTSDLFVEPSAEFSLAWITRHPTSEISKVSWLQNI